METVEVLPTLLMLRFPVGQAYLWHDSDSLTLIDAGFAGSGPAIADAIRGLGRRQEELRAIVLTHHHPDHAGGAAEVAAWNGAAVLAHRLEAPVVRGEQPAIPPVLTDEDRALYERIVGTGNQDPSPPSGVDREVEDGDVLDFGGGAEVLWGPGHTAGSIGIFLPHHGVLFTGDTVANQPALRLGVFNTDRAATIESFKRFAALETEIACFGHGDPVIGDSASQLRTVAADIKP
ncbi:MBL fold metallo-hydrolase [Fodinicola feengrottensis]|uniref:MBL fold metallo-hydrolase n=1 Tax=Fodinicola feengrottensis TaxID=435914 RepID=A0ABN2HYU6_9ACTN